MERQSSLKNVKKNYFKHIIDASVDDVRNESYIVNTADGRQYQIPIGTIEIDNGVIIDVGDRNLLKLHVPEESQNYDESSQTQTEECNASSCSNSTIHSEQHLEKNFADWKDEPTKLLISLYKEYKPLVETRKLKTMKKMWEKICSEMHIYNYFYTSQQIESKWKSLERAFKNKIENSRKTGRGRRTCPYERELSEILVQRKNIIPPCVMDTNHIIDEETILQETGLNTDLCETDENSEGLNQHTETEQKQREKNRQYGKLRNKEIKLLADAIENRTIQKKLEEEKKIEQRERLIKEMQRKNDLFEKLLSITESSCGKK